MISLFERRGRGTGQLSVVIAAAFAFDLLVLGLMHVLRPEVDPITEPTSNYSIGSYGSVALAAVIAVGVGSLALAYVMRVERHDVRKLGIGLLAVFGVCKLLMVFFPIDVDPAVASTTSGAIHNVLGNVAFFAIPVAAILLSSSLGSASKVLSWLLAVSAIVVLASDVFGAFGIAQRAFLVLSSLWTISAAMTVRRWPGSESDRDSMTVPLVDPI